MDYLDMKIKVLDVRPDEPYLVKIRSDATCEQVKAEVVARFEEQLPKESDFYMWDEIEKRIIEAQEEMGILGANHTLVFSKDLPRITVIFEMDTLMSSTELPNSTGYQLYQPDTAMRFPLTLDSFILGRGITNNYAPRFAKIVLDNDAFIEKGLGSQFISRHHALFYMDNNHRYYFVTPLEGKIYLNNSKDALKEGSAARLYPNDRIWLREDDIHFVFQRTT